MNGWYNDYVTDIKAMTTENAIEQAIVKKEPELAPCPFCKKAKKAEVREHTPTNFWEGSSWFFVVCRCGACGPRARTKKTAIKNWNASGVASS